MKGLSTEIIKVLDALCEKFGLAVDWTATNVMPYLETICSKIINYEIAISCVWIVIGVAICVICLMLFNAIHKNTEFGVDRYEYHTDDSTGRFIACILIGFAFITGLICIITQTFDIVTCLTFEEKILIEEFSSIYNQIK